MAKLKIYFEQQLKETEIKLQQDYNRKIEQLNTKFQSEKTCENLTSHLGGESKSRNIMINQQLHTMKDDVIEKLIRNTLNEKHLGDNENV